MWLNLAAVSLCGLAILGAAQLAEGTFAASPGFSGRGGVTCTSCHRPPQLIYPEASALLEGLPETWSLGQSYELKVRVTGGPPAMPAPQPQGGFDLASDGGTFRVPAPAEGLLRTVGPFEVTYNPAGTLQREWTVLWEAPTLARRPAPVGFWLAAMAANGNHVVATNTSDQGETLDMTDAVHLQVAPDAAALEAWRALPLSPPTASLRQDAKGLRVTGQHQDANATDLAWRLDGGPWATRATGPQWALRLDGISSGTHVLEVHSRGDERASPVESLAFQVQSGRATALEAKPASASSPSVVVALLAGLALLSRSRPPSSRSPP